MNFIERIFGVSPDAGSGAFELALAVLPILCAVLLAAYRRFRRGEHVLPANEGA
jgi:hypothetical protein